MLSKVRRAISDLKPDLARFDESCLDGAGARALTEAGAELERIGAAIKTLAAGRLDDVNAHDASYRSSAHYLAKIAGTSVFAAEQTLKTAHQIEQLPATEAALRTGALSSMQVKEVAAAASADPSAEAEMLQRAHSDGIKGLRSAAARVIAAAARDQDDEHARIDRERSWRHWRDHDGAGCISIRGPLELTARAALALAPYEAELFEATKDLDERVPHEALMFDAFIAMADASTGAMPKGAGPRPTVVVRVDHAALVRGDTEPGEVSEIIGVGPIPVSVIKQMAEDAYLKALITTGKDVLSVSHLGRTIPAHLRTALDDLFPECAIEGCNVSWGLDIDHNEPVELLGPTAMWNLNKLCRYHHRYKHRHDLRLIGEGTSKRFVPVAEWQAPAPLPSRRRTSEPLAAA